MKKLYFVVFMLSLVAFVFEGCSVFNGKYPKEVRIRVESSPQGMVFSGTYGNTDVMSYVEGDTTPQEYVTELKRKNDMVGGTFCKVSSGKWKFTVKLFVNGKLEREGNTSKPSSCISLEYTDINPSL